jgi:Excalibur calcium-binding domain
MRKLVAGVAVVLFTLGGAGVAQAQTADKDCKDFATLAEAEAWHEEHPEDRLDADNDGRVCEAQFPGQDGTEDEAEAKVPTKVNAGL